MKNTELLAPAGSLEKLKIAIKYGADAVYFGLPSFSLRARASQFNEKELVEGAEFCRKEGKKFFVALNIYAHNIHLDNLSKPLRLIKKIKPDGIILSDPGVLRIVKKELPEINIHISTQANVTNKEAAKFWAEQGVKRIILAREVSLKEIKEIKQAVPEVELECFVHGAMCMAYSGRCILSKWMLNRSANLGDCAQPCRWAYRRSSEFGKFRCLPRQSEAEAGRPLRDSRHLPKKVNFARCSGSPRASTKIRTPNSLKDELCLKSRIADDKNRFEIDIEEDKTGTYLFNSNDICLIEHLGELQKAGVDSFKIEGRNKSVYYTAMVIRAYRQVLNSLQGAEPRATKAEIKRQKQELEKLSSRGYWTGFMFQKEPPHLFKKASVKAQDEFVGISLINLEKKDSESRKVFVHNHFYKGEQLEVVTPSEIFKVKILEITDEKNNSLKSAHGGQDKIFKIKFDKPIQGLFVLRKSDLAV